MKLKTRFRRMVLAAGLEEAEYAQVRLEMWESNRRSVFTFTIVAALIFSLMTGLTFLVPALRNMRWLYLVSAIVCMFVTLLAGGPARGRTRLSGFLMYTFMTLLLLFGILLGTVFTPHELTTSYIALLLAAPQIFSDRPYRMYCFIGGSVVLFIILCLIFKDRSLWSSDITNAMVFCLVSAACGTYVMRFKLERYCFELRIRVLAETDQLTGVLNRNSYEQQLARGPELDAQSLFSVYVDVNGLHEINNTRGHTAGDEMLRFVAQAMVGIFGRENTYRIGGDEFVALGLNRSEDDVRASIAALQDTVAAAGYHIASGLGWNTKAELDVAALVRAAEQEMYANKEAYYRANGIPRESR